MQATYSYTVNLLLFFKILCSNILLGNYKNKFNSEGEKVLLVYVQ